MIRGKFIGNKPLIRVAIASNQSIQTPFVLLDTGFTGDLKITREMVNELGLKIIGVAPIEIANGQTIETPTALALSAMEGSVKDVEVIVSDGVPAAGIGFFSKFDYRVVIDCRNRDVVLEKV